MRAEFLGGPRDGLVAEVDVPPRAQLRVTYGYGNAAWYALVLEDSDRLVYMHKGDV